MKNYKVAKVTWDDAAMYERHQSIESLRDHGCLERMETTGFIIKANRKVVMLAHEIDSQGYARNTSIIARKDVTNIEYLEPCPKTK